MSVSVRARRLAAATLIAGVAALHGGCATLPPPQPIPDVASIAGTWSGTIDFGRGFELLYLTINPDGALVAWWGLTTRFGRVELGEGRPRFKLYVWSGDLEYLASGEERLLVLKEDFGGFYAQVRPYR